jgi:hypothetical protein
MPTIKRFSLMLIVFALTSCAIHTNFLQQQYDKRLERLQRERDKLTRPIDPVSRTKTDITIADILLTLAGDAVKANEPEVLGKRLNEYVDTIHDAQQTMMKTGRDAQRKSKGFKDLELALRRQIRVLKDLARSVTFDQREPVERARQEAENARDDLLKALFGEQNAPSHKS